MRNKFFSWIKKHPIISIIILLLILLLFGVPYIINELYKAPHGYLTLWEAKDVLSFYGSVLSFIGTVFLGTLALYQNYSFKESNKAKERLNIRPYLFTSINDELPIYLAENKVEYVQVVVSNQKVDVKSVSENLPDDIKKYSNKKKEHNDFLNLTKDEQNQKIDQHLVLLNSQTKIIEELKKKYELIRYAVGNYGHGSAVKIDILLNDKKVVPLFCLAQNSNRTFYFLCDFDSVAVNSNIIFNITISYYDVEDYGPYKQTETFYVSKKENGFLSLNYSQQISTPSYEKE